MQQDRYQKIRASLLKHVPNNGDPIGNGALRKKLGQKPLSVTESEYWEVRNELLSEGLLARGRGKGGSVFLAKPEPPKKVSKKPARESDLYIPFEQAIIKGYIPEQDIKEYVIQRTAQQGQRKTGGKWTRPDLTVIAKHQYQYIPGTKIEIITFEIKPNYITALDGIFEALAHSAFAHRSYLAVDISSFEDGDELPDERIVRECERFGLGYITFDDVTDFDTYDIYIPAKLKEPNSAAADQFIASQINKEHQEKIRSWTR